MTGIKSMILINGYELPAHVSYSALTTYLDCGWKYYLTRVEKIIEQPTWYLAGGSAVHTATEMYDKELFEAEGK
jgi:RecB family exonuclease